MVSNAVSVSSVDTTSVEVAGLFAGFEYTFNITAENSNGSSSILCGPTLHVIGESVVYRSKHLGKTQCRLNHYALGIPAAPVFGNLMSGPNAGEVTIMIKTVASGVDSPSQVFQFVITPVLDGIEGDSISYPFHNYQSNTFQALTVSGLKQEESYTFNATAINVFGASEPATSAEIPAGE